MVFVMATIYIVISCYKVTHGSGTLLEITALTVGKEKSNLFSTIKVEDMPQELVHAKNYIQQVPTVFSDA